MLTTRLQEAIDANAGDTLDFLERTSRSTPFYREETKQPNGTGEPLVFEVERKNNIISIYASRPASDSPADEIIHFEVLKRTKSVSMINAFYQHDNPQFLLIFYRIWTRLAIGFAAPLAARALAKLHELE